MKNHNSSSFSSESDDDSDDEDSSSKSSKSTSSASSLNITFNQPVKPPTAEHPQILSLFESADKKSEESSEDDEEDAEDSSSAASPAPRRTAASRSVGSLVGNAQQPKPSAEVATPVVASEIEPETVQDFAAEQLNDDPVDVQDIEPEATTFEDAPIEAEDQAVESETPNTPPPVTLPRPAPIRAAPAPAPAQGGRNTGGTGGNNGGRGGGAVPPRVNPAPFNRPNPTPNTAQYNNMPTSNQAPAAPNTIIERTDSSGAALAFMGALYLNRRRKKNIKALRRDIENTNKQIDTEQRRVQKQEEINKNEHRAQERRTTTLEQARATQNRVNDKLATDTNRALKNSTANTAPIPTAPEQQPLQPTFEQVPAPTVAIKNEQIINQAPESIARKAAELAAVPAAVAANELASKTKDIKLTDEEMQSVPQAQQRYEAPELKKSQQAAPERVQSITESPVRTSNESVMSKRREAQDDKAAKVFAGAQTSSKSQTQTQQYQPPTVLPSVSAPQQTSPTQSQPPISQTQYDDTVKKSLQAGVGVGIVAIVLGLLAYFLMA